MYFVCTLRNVVENSAESLSRAASETTKVVVVDPDIAPGDLSQTICKHDERRVSIATESKGNVSARGNAQTRPIGIMNQDPALSDVVDVFSVDFEVVDGFGAAVGADFFDRGQAPSARRTCSPGRRSLAGTKDWRSSLQKGWFAVVPSGAGSPVMWTSITSARVCS